jgi:cobalamin transport system ATP-binding protein
VAFSVEPNEPDSHHHIITSAVVRNLPDSLTVADVEFAYGRVPALRGVSLTVASGAFVGVVGPNGSGKSTLVKLLSGYLRPQRGTVRLGDNEVSGLRPRERARRIALVPQDMPVTFDFTTLEVVLMGRFPHLSPLGVESARDVSIARAAMRQTRTEALEDRSLGALSGGERQRVLLARALAQQTPILLLDEPTAHLDVNFQIETLRLLRALHSERGVTVLTVLHDLNLASLYCAHLVMLASGRLLAEGPPEVVLTPEQLEAVYDARIWCEVHPVTQRPYVLPLVREHVSHEH